MPRKRSGTPRPKPRRLLHIATHLPTEPGPLLVHCKASWEGFTGDPEHFPTPHPPPAEIEAGLKDLGDALLEAENGGPSDKSALKAAADHLRDLWGQLGRYAQGVLRQTAPNDIGPILARVMMYESNVGTKRPKQPLEAQRGPRSGVVKLVALAVAGTLTYIWEWSWNEVDWSTTTTGESYVTLDGLTPGKLYHFRFRCFLRGNMLTGEVASITFMVT